MKVVTFGEIMLRLSPPGNSRIVQASSFDIRYGGGEANVAVFLAALGHESYFVTRVPSHEIGDAAVNALRALGVNTSYVSRGGERLGIYFLESGASVRPSKVIYDRKGSAVAEAQPGDFDFREILKGAKWFHFTGITPALGEGPAALVREALTAARELGVTVSADLNYRKKLWSPEQARSVMIPLMEYVNVCIGNEEDAEHVLGYKAGATDVRAGDLDLEGYKDIFIKMKERFGFDIIASTLRESFNASENAWSALIYDGTVFHRSRRYDLRIVDRVGSGDAFAAGLIAGLMEGKSSVDACEFAAAASALKHTVPGDFNVVSRAEVEALLAGDVSGRVQR